MSFKYPYASPTGKPPAPDDAGSLLLDCPDKGVKAGVTKLNGNLNGFNHLKSPCTGVAPQAFVDITR